MLREHIDSAARIPVMRLVSGCKRWPHSTRYEVIAHAIVDAEDAEYVGSFRWVTRGKKNHGGYVCRNIQENGSVRHINLHIEVWERRNGPVPDGLTVDHRNRDKLDNRGENLRLATRLQQSYNQPINSRNQTGYKGVHVFAESDRFKVTIGATTSVGMIRFALGEYDTAEEAGLAYNEGAAILHGEFANPNPIPEGSVSERRAEEVKAIVQHRIRVRLSKGVRAR